MWTNMCGEHTNLPTLIVSKWVLWLAYQNHQTPMSYILDNLVGKPLNIVLVGICVFYLLLLHSIIVTG